MHDCISMIGRCKISAGFDQVVIEGRYLVTHVDFRLIHLRPLRGNCKPINGIPAPASRHFTYRNGDGDQPRRIPYMVYTPFKLSKIRGGTPNTYRFL